MHTEIYKMSKVINNINTNNFDSIAYFGSLLTSAVFPMENTERKQKQRYNDLDESNILNI